MMKIDPSKTSTRLERVTINTVSDTIWATFKKDKATKFSKLGSEKR